MSLLLTLVQSPRPQAVRQMRLEDGSFVIGRSADCDWRIDDPDQYVSRSHCTITGRAGAFTVTDTSSGGLFVDDARTPLGPLQPLPLRDGMRLRLGDYVLRVELRSEAASARPPEPPASGSFDRSDFFSEARQDRPRPVRPRDLPDPFEPPSSFVPAADTASPERRGPPVFDDPFTLDPTSPSRLRERPAPPGFDTGARPEPAPRPAPRPPTEEAWFARAEPKAPPAPTERTAAFEWDLPTPGATEPAPRSAEAEAAFDWGKTPEPEIAPPAGPPPKQPAAPPAVAPDAGALFDALLRGLGLDAADAPAGDRLARMEAFGREYRMMAEGLMQLLRIRAQEKGNARIAQTVVGASEVNPLKFMPTVDDALAIMIARRSGGFAGTDAAIAGAVRDLAAHHVATWRGTQAALGRLIDRFDPAALERELESLGLLETLLAGGRRAKLWELYERRFRAIAQSAETQFLGEVGADFREAYEREG